MSKAQHPSSGNETVPWKRFHDGRAHPPSFDIDGLKKKKKKKPHVTGTHSAAFLGRACRLYDLAYTVRDPFTHFRKNASHFA